MPRAVRSDAASCGQQPRSLWPRSTTINWVGPGLEPWCAHHPVLPKPAFSDRRCEKPINAAFLAIFSRCLRISASRFGLCAQFPAPVSVPQNPVPNAHCWEIRIARDQILFSRRRSLCAPLILIKGRPVKAASNLAKTISEPRQ
jgi:hypothetical protein